MTTTAQTANLGPATVDDVLRDVVSSVERDQHLIIDDLIDRMVERIEAIDAYYRHDYGNRCTYSTLRSAYVGARILLHRVENNWRRDVTGSMPRPRAGSYFDKITDIRERVRLLRGQMYSNPCKTCHDCQARTKPWPTPKGILTDSSANKVMVFSGDHRRTSLGDPCRFLRPDETFVPLSVPLS